MSASGSAVVRLAEVTDAALSVDACLAAVADPAAGGTTVFVGAVRDSDGGRPVEQLDYSAHPSAAERLRQIAEAVVVAASAPHRAEAFAACRRLIEDIKTDLPIWKRQAFEGGEVEWVGTP